MQIAKPKANVHMSPFIFTNRFSFSTVYQWMIKGISIIGRFYLTCPKGLENHFHVDPMTGRVLFSQDFFPK